MSGRPPPVIIRTAPDSVDDRKVRKSHQWVGLDRDAAVTVKHAVCHP